MRVYAFEASGPALIPDTGLSSQSGPRFGWADALPTTGYWKAGDILVVGAALNVCTAEGSPGTWAPVVPVGP